MQREAERTPAKMSAKQSVNSLLEDECLPEVTLLDDTCDSFLPGSVPATPVTAGSFKSWITSLQLSQLTSSPNSNSKTEIIPPLNKSMDLSQSDVNISKVENDTCNKTPKWDGMKKLSEMRSIDRKSDKENNKDYSPVLSRHAWTTANDPDDQMKVLSESICAPFAWRDSSCFPDITLLDVTRDSELSQVEDLSSTDVTQDRTPVANLENNQPPSEFSEQSGTEPDGSYMVPREKLSSTSTITGHVTHTTISFNEKSDKSVGGYRTQTSLEVTQDISSSSRPSLEPIGSNMVKIETSAEKTFGAHPANVTHDLSSSSDMSAQCAASQLSTSDGKCNTSLKNVTSELNVEPVLDCNSVEANDKSLTSHDAEVTTKETQPSPKTSGSVNTTSDNGMSANGMSANGTFTSLQPSQSSSSTDLNATAEITSPRNKTMDLPPSDVNSCKAKSQVTEDATSVINNTIEGSQNQNDCAVNASGPSNMGNGTFLRPESKLEAVNSGDDRHRTQDLSQSGLPVMDGFSDSLAHQGMDTERNTFNLDDTLDLNVKALTTSTPMPTKDECRILGVKTIKPDGQVPYEVPSNLVCDRQTFMKLVAPKSRLPALKTASQFKHKMASALPGRFEALTFRQTVTRQRAEALRNAAAAAAAPPQTAGISSSYTLRATTRSKQLNSSLQRSQLSGLPTGIQRAVTGLRPLSMITTSSSSKKLCGPAATCPGTKTPAKKQPLTRGEPLPLAKRKKMEAAVLASTAAEIPPSCAAVGRAKALKLPATSQRTPYIKPKGHGCAHCAELEQQLKRQLEEIRTLKEGRAHCEQQLKMQSEEMRRLKEGTENRDVEEEDL